jgi:hypothetical protein
MPTAAEVFRVLGSPLPTLFNADDKFLLDQGADQGLLADMGC